MQWHEPEFRWLENPLRQTPRRYEYSFSSGGPQGFDPNVVLNHRVRERINPDGVIEGFLLGVGQSPIPSSYRDRMRLSTRLSIFDELGECYETDIHFLVCRSKRTRNDRGIHKVARGPLLLKKD